MARPKSPINRDFKQKNKLSDRPIVVRLPEDLKQRLEKKGSVSKIVRNLLEKNFKEKKSPYKCDKCGCKIKVGEFYYINLEHIEKFVEEEEIEVIVSTIQKILCAKCSGNKFGELMAKPSQDEQKVKESEREAK
jgi:hypothetical protein